MRVGVVTTSYPRWQDDPAGSFVDGHVRWMVGCGHEVEVVAAGCGHEVEVVAAGCGEVEVEGVRVYRVPAAGDLFYAGGAPEALAGGGWAPLHAARFSLGLVAEVARRARAWDVIVAHWLAPSAVAAALAGRGRPLVAIAHSGDVHLLCRTRLATPVAALLRAARAEMVFVSSAVRERFARAVHPLWRSGIEAASVCSMGIDVARFRRAAGARAGGSGTVLFLGRLVPVKGIATAIEAAARWRCGAKLVIAGAGPEAAGLRALADALPDARVEFVGEVRGRDRDRLLAAADAVVLPSVYVEAERTEGMPVVALEAMAARVPLIASRVGGLGELPPGAVALVQPGDSEALAREVDRLVSDCAARERQIRVADAVAERHDWANVGPRLAARLR